MTLAVGCCCVVTAGNAGWVLPVLQQPSGVTGRLEGLDTWSRPDALKGAEAKKTF